MKLYVKDSNGKVYIKETAPNRRILAAKIGSNRFTINGRQFRVADVKAEAEKSGTSTGVVVGGLLGLLAGPIGLIAGGALGGLIGSNNDVQEEEVVSNFNSSTL